MCDAFYILFVLVLKKLCRTFADISPLTKAEISWLSYKEIISRGFYRDCQPNKDKLAFMSFNKNLVGQAIKL